MYSHPDNALNYSKIYRKTKFKRLLLRLLPIIENAVLWLFIGVCLGGYVTSMGVTDALQQVDKILVCK